jgi:hypothetical protein
MKIGIFLIILLSLLFSCGSRVTDIDKQLAVTIETKYQNNVQINFKRDVYLNLNSKIKLEYNEIIDIYRTFFFIGDQLRQNTSYVYLNYYDNGKFIYQIYYSPSESEFIKTNADYY